jgi:hypothetical protein
MLSGSLIQPLMNIQPDPLPDAPAAGPGDASFSPKIKSCIVCGKQFKPYRHWQVYCGLGCRKKGYWMTHEVIVKEKLDGQVL